METRVADVPATVEETALPATLTRATAMTARMPLEQGEIAPVVSDEILRAAYWKAARTGIDGDGVDTVNARIMAVSALLAELVRHLEPALEELGDRSFVTDTIPVVLARGNGAGSMPSACIGMSVMSYWNWRPPLRKGASSIWHRQLRDPCGTQPTTTISTTSASTS
ncbi:hypothetical protein [Nocardia huaxiensis]|uniref:hypothetical protein n=1 Tax=Nocardia huaxiensis TaxID=2755382 RepID=UPI001E2CD153|nr:hypothetical protein [Nocardia huaxiensis]UFS95299.1 hypothetical protein LPY97_32165 [Nocardia huaxiensis]